MTSKKNMIEGKYFYTVQGMEKDGIFSVSNEYDLPPKAKILTLEQIDQWIEQKSRPVKYLRENEAGEEVEIVYTPRIDRESFKIYGDIVE